MRTCSTDISSAAPPLNPQRSSLQGCSTLEDYITEAEGTRKCFRKTHQQIVNERLLPNCSGKQAKSFFQLFYFTRQMKARLEEYLRFCRHPERSKKNGLLRLLVTGRYVNASKRLVKYWWRCRDLPYDQPKSHNKPELLQIKKGFDASCTTLCARFPSKIESRY